MKQKHFVACLPDAWSHKVTRLHVTQGYDNDGFGSLTQASDPWGVRKVNGTRCSLLQGATGAVHGKRISYGCTRTTYLVGNVHKKSALWTIAPRARDVRRKGRGDRDRATQQGVVRQAQPQGLDQRVTAATSTSSRSAVRPQATRR